eukprot:g6286.t1
MDKKSGRKKVKRKDGKRVFKLRATKPTSSHTCTDATPAGTADGASNGTDAAASEEPSLPLPQPSPLSSADLLLSMEQQLRAGITPTLPASAHERADLLASSLLPNGNGGDNAAPVASADPSSEPSPGLSRFVVPMAPSLTKKRARPRGRGSAGFAVWGDATADQGRRSRARRGEAAAGGGGGDSALPFYVPTEWEFVKGKNGAAALEKPTFFWELWMMMAAFGDPRGSVTCKCAAHGKKSCACIEGVTAMEAIVKAMGVRLVEVCREWSDGKRIEIKHIRMAMPGEMREYMAWKEAHSKRGTKNEVERGADLRLEGLDDDTNSDSDPDPDPDPSEDDEGDEEVAGRAANVNATAATPKPENGESNGAENGGTRATAGLGVGGDSGGEAAVKGVGAKAAGKGDGERKPWKTKIKPQQQEQQRQQQQQAESDGAEPREWALEEEEVASRMGHRKRFADERTASMEEDDYVNTFFEFRKAFFMSHRGGGHTVKVAKARGESCPGSRVFLARYLGLDADCTEAGDRKLLEILAYMLYDHVGRVVEAAIRKRSGGRLVCGDSDPMLSAEEVAAAGATLPPLPGREQRENVRASRAANPDGISHNRPLARFPVGLERRGEPLRWPRNMIRGDRVVVEGGEEVDASAQGLAEEAMALLENDFADL